MPFVPVANSIFFIPVVVPVTFILLAEFTFVPPVPDVISLSCCVVANVLSVASVPSNVLVFNAPVPSKYNPNFPLTSALPGAVALSKINPVGSINPSTVSLPDINKSTLFPFFSKCAPDVLGLCSPNITIFPVPFGASVILPPAPLFIVIEPVVPFPVFNITSLLPFDLKTPAADPVPAANSPLIRTVPSVEFVIVSSFSNIIPLLLLTVREPFITVLPVEEATVNLSVVPS